MPLNLDSCITGIFIPGNIGASSGQTPVIRTIPSFELGVYSTVGTAAGVGTASGTRTTAGAAAAAGTGAASGVGSTGGTSAEATAFLARTTGLDSTHTNAYTALIDGLVADGVWSKLDLLHVYATQDATTALLNLVSTSYPATLIGSPTFTADRGYTGTANSSIYIDLGFNPVTATSPKYTQNSAHMSAWSVANLVVGRPIMGSLINPVECSLYPMFTDSNAYFRVNDSGAFGGVAVGNSVGHYIANRPNSTTGEGYKNGSQIKTGADTSVAPGNQNFYALGYHYSAGGGTGSSHQCAMASMGSSLSSTDATNFYNRLRTYMTAMGVP